MAVDDLGTPGEVWTMFAELLAELVQRDTKEFLDRRGATDVETVVFRTRFSSGITTADRVAWNGTRFNIREIVPIGRNRGLELRCEAQDGGDA